jgi:RNA polymerase II elongation factor ELL
MALNMPETLVLSSSADMMSGLPQQAFALTLSDNIIEDMIACVQKGQEIQLSLGDTPVSYCFSWRFLFVTVVTGLLLAIS